MEYFWREHKRFVWLVATFVAVTGISSCAFILPAFRDADRASRDRQNAMQNLTRRLEEEGVPYPEDIERAENDLTQMKADLKKLGENVEIRLKAPFEVPPEERNPKLHLQNTVIRTQQDLTAAASKKGVKLPKTLGFPPDVPSELAAEYLARLGIVHRVLQLALETVDPGQGRPGISEILSVNPRAEPGLAEQDRALDPAAFLGRYLVEIKLAGTSDGLFSLLHGLLQEDRFLGIHQLTIAHESPTDNRMECTLTVAGFHVNPEATTEKAKQDWMQ